MELATCDQIFTNPISTVIFAASKRVILFFSALFFTIEILAFPTTDPTKKALTDDQKNIISYFQEVALGFEYGETSAVTRKWITAMKIYVGGSPNSTLRQELNRVVNELNLLVKGDLKIEFTNKKEESNMFIFFGTRAGYAQLYPRQASLLPGNSGLCTITWNNKNEIIKGHIFVKTENENFVEQRHVIREELTQALGFGKDSPRYKESIFQSAYTTPTEFSEIDRELIKLLYNQNVKPGMTAEQANSILTDLLLAESMFEGETDQKNSDLSNDHSLIVLKAE